MLYITVFKWTVGLSLWIEDGLANFNRGQNQENVQYWILDTVKYFVRMTRRGKGGSEFTREM